VITLDTETPLICPGLPFPPIVCVQWAVDDEPPRLMARADGGSFGAWFRWALESNHLLVGHHIAYDLGVLCSEAPDCIPLVFAALRENRITDTMWRQKLADIGRGCYRGMFAASGAWIPLNYSLEAVGKRHGVAKRGDDPWRLRYAELGHIPSAQWPPEAISYALGDIEATRAAYLGQRDRYAPELLVDEYAQMRAFFAAELTSGWGLRTSPEGVRQFEAGVRAEFDEIQAILVEHELVRPNGSKDTKRAKARMLEALGEAGVRRTPPSKRFPRGDISLDSDACIGSGDQVL
jgi:hypothetical protein